MHCWLLCEWKTKIRTHWAPECPAFSIVLIVIADVIVGKDSRVAQSRPHNTLTALDSALKVGAGVQFLLQRFPSYPQGSFSAGLLAHDFLFPT